jgi:thiamine phosphate synthase YjbQ (UPF0047 family)
MPHPPRAAISNAISLTSRLNHASTNMTMRGRTTCPRICAALTQTSLTIPVIGGRLTLGTWQGIYVFEHRRAPHRRHLALHLIGE